ncbi:MAG TPA: pantoate--beta-alanine ligase, partial [Bryobacteraceae bacterium]|nr:pantoate--beta-alanine ligase [Bryobacteraceae bacterium]
FQALDAARISVMTGSRRISEIRGAGLKVLAGEPRISVEYFEIVDAENMQAVTDMSGRICIAAAIWLGSVRLIDNLSLPPRS